MFNGIIVSRNDPISRSIHINIYNELNSRGSCHLKYVDLLFNSLAKLKTYSILKLKYFYNKNCK